MALAAAALAPYWHLYEKVHRLQAMQRRQRRRLERGASQELAFLSQLPVWQPPCVMTVSKSAIMHFSADR